MTVQQQEVDEAKVEAFMGKVLGDFCGAMATLLCALGDRLGLFKALAAGPRHAARSSRSVPASTSATRSSGCAAWPPPGTSSTTRERRVRAAARARAGARSGGRPDVPRRRLPGDAAACGRVRRARRARSGPAAASTQDALPARTSGTGMERFTNGWFENHLLQEWLPAMPDVAGKARGRRACADVGCGAGRALDQARGGVPGLASRRLRRLRRAARAGARRTPKQAGVGDRVRFEKRDAAQRAPRAVRRDHDVRRDPRRGRPGRPAEGDPRGR